MPFSSQLFASSLQNPQTLTVQSPQQVVSADFNGDGRPDLMVAGGSCGSSTLYPFFGQANGTFAAGSPFGTPSNPCAISALAAADLNGDGKQDVVLVDAGTFTLQFYLGNGSGGFAAQPPITLPNTPGGVVVGDFNGDGIPDIIVELPGAGTDLFQYFKGNGDGTFAAGVNVGGATVSCSQSGTIATDLNNDGKLDLITACQGLSEIVVLLGKGNGTFQAETVHSVPNGVFAVAAADFNRDGNIDIVSYGSGGLEFLQGNGVGGFKAAAPITSLPSSSGGDIKVLDFDGDGIPDLVLSDTGSTVIGLLRGRGDGTFILTPGIFFGTGASPGALAVLDVNADGIPDVAVANPSDGLVNVFLGTSATPLFETPLPDPGNTAESIALGDLNNDGSIDAVTISRSSSQIFAYLNNGFGGLVNPFPGQAAGIAPQMIALGDLNGDGKLDAVVTDVSSNTVGVFLGNGDGTFQNMVTYATGSQPEGVAIADLNHDGKLDVIVANSNAGSVSVFLGNGDGTLQTPAKTFATDPNPFDIVVADFNHDGNLDLGVAVFGKNTVSILLGKGDGTFQAQKPFITGLLTPMVLTSGDFNGDGIPDLAVSGHLQVGIYLGNGDGTFTMKGSPYSAGPGNTVSIQTADVNGDGILDLVVPLSNTINFGVFLGKGDGTFQPMQQFNAAFSQFAPTPSFAAVADINHDGTPDVIVAAGNAGPSVILNNGSASGSGQLTYKPKVDFGAGTGPAGLTIADFNGDGKDDVAVANSGSANVSVLFGAGGSTLLGTAANYSTGANTTPVAITAGDFNQDGFPDLAVTNDNASANGAVMILLNDKTGKFPSIAHTYTVGMHPRAITASDVDGDGKLDLEVTNGGDGTVSVLFGNGDGSFQTPQTFAKATRPGSAPAPVPSAVAPVQTLNGMATADLNGDGKPDMIAADSTTSSVEVRLNLGSKTFAAPVSYLSGGSSTASIAVGDVNGDGKPDIVAANYATSNITVFLNKGNGTFTLGKTFSVTNGTGKGPFDIQLLDFNGDGRLDVVTVNFDDSTVSAMLGNGNGTFQTPVIYPVQLNPEAIRRAQIGGSRNGLVSSASNGLISVLLPAVNTTVSGSTSVNPAIIGQLVTITATVKPASGAVTPTGMITFSQAGTQLGQVSLSGGKASISVSTLPGGSDSVLMSYGGDLVNNPSSNTLTQEVIVGTSTTSLAASGSQVFGAALTLTANVSGAGPTPTGAVSFKDGATVLGSAPLIAGVANFQTTTLAIGSHNIAAVYNGSSSYSASTSGSVDVEIQPATPTVEITSSNQSVVQGMNVTFTATVTSNGAAPKGTITFLDGATTLSSVALASGQATFATTALTVGPHTIKAKYSGNLGSASDTVIQIVYASGLTASSVALSSTALAPNQLVFLRNHALPATPGGVKFTAAITCTGQTPTGTVQFYDDDKLLTPTAKTVSASKATFTYTQLTLGKHRIIAVYSGDANCGGSVKEKDTYRDPKPLSLH